jgi:uncharacterized protein YdaU (DUF1376 family)
VHYYQFNIADYANSTQHLEPLEDLAYRRMLDLYYMKEKPLPLDVAEIARLIRMRSHSDSIAVVLQDFFIKTKDGFVNMTADEVLSGIYDKSEKARNAANARWNKIKELQENTEDADAMQTHSDGTADGMLPNTHNPIPITNGSKLPSISSQSVVDAYHEILPMMAHVQVLSDKRKTSIRNFFRKRSTEKGGQFTVDNFRAYLAYIATNCQWMTEDRPNGKGGFWKAKNFDYIIKDDCYIAVKEQRFDNMENK